MALSPTSSRGASAGSVPTGGTTGQALEKASNANFDTTWASISAAVSSVFTRTGAVVAADGDYYGAVGAAKTGAVQVSRYAGATASGAPVAGTFAVGDFVIDQAGGIWTCTVAGTPGTWAPAVPAASVTNTHIAPGAAIAASKIQGGSNAASGGLYLLSTTTRGSSGQINVSGIDQSYSDLVGIAIVRAASAVVNDELHIELNGDTTAGNYNYSDNFNIGTSPTAQESQAGNQIAQSIPDTSATANRFGVCHFEICGYTSTSWHKTVVSWWGTSYTDSSGQTRCGTAVTEWKNTAAVTQVNLRGQNGAQNLLALSTLRLYGRP